MDFLLPVAFPRCVESVGCGSGRGKEPSGENVLRLIQIRLTTPSLEKILAACQDNFLRADRRFEFQKCIPVERIFHVSLAANVSSGDIQIEQPIIVVIAHAIPWQAVRAWMLPRQSLRRMSRSGGGDTRPLERRHPQTLYPYGQC